MASRAGKAIISPPTMIVDAQRQQWLELPAFAVQCERYSATRSTKAPAPDDPDTKPGAAATVDDNDSDKPPGPSPAARPLPSCLNDECEGQHLLKEIGNSLSGLRL